MNLGKPIAKGNTAKIYLSDNKIVKLFNDFLPDTESIKEANKQKYAYSCGLPVPEILDVTNINGKQAIIMEYFKGETLGDLMAKEKDQTEYFLNMSVDVQLKIHSINPNPEAIEPMHDKLLRQIESVNEFDKNQKSDLVKKLESLSYESRLCHGDFHIFNLIKTGDEVVVIDWVDSSAGDICADVYRTYLLYSHLSTELADMYLRLYCEKSGVSKSDVFQWAPVIAGARLSESVSTENSERLMKIINNDSTV
ncbi:aminoglycoside phosphotransferase [Salipaludibacillus keqinensis]|uniref:Aminoglycoside phosphotransferase n=1 Tax=Salipaludibacillus keqinensis TaxID=2045207 RepID=A0A323TQL1_9BACI|nr:aminoglycoside phosphotransferase family protein [Salipaludibacillus keqinensis]PYZ94783.1 aminoglycoside phosphotransferase [Salipaludibacillus keqinensis]